jgi:hypothetical protein
MNNPNPNLVETRSMNLVDQIQTLIDDAPQDGTTPELVRAIAPILTSLAERLRHLRYYLVQTLQHDWAILTIQTEAEPNTEPTEKTVVYAFPTLKDTMAGPFPTNDPGLISLPLPVTHILFQLVAMEGIDSIIFFETPGNVEIGIEIQRQEVMAWVQQQLQPPVALTPDIPADFA